MSIEKSVYVSLCRKHWEEEIGRWPVKGPSSMTTDRRPPPSRSGALTIRTLAMPADTNPAGDIFGGWVMSQMDIAGAIAAVERAKGRVVTVAVEAMTFIAPVKVGDILCVYTTDRAGRQHLDHRRHRSLGPPQPPRRPRQGHRRPLRLRGARRTGAKATHPR